MEAIKDVGEVVTVFDNDRLWRIPNFYDLPQEYNTVIRSPRFRRNAQDWYMEVYPDGRKLYSSSGWFGISALNLNADSNFHLVVLGIRGDVKEDNLIRTVGESNGDGFYSCTRFLPKLLLKSWKELFMRGGDLCLYFSMDSLNTDEDTLVTHLIREDVQEWFKELYENVSPESPIQEEEEKEMPLKTDVGEIFADSEAVKWTILNFWDLPQEYDAVIKSPRFRFKDRDWYLEIYPNGRRSHSSLGWFGINVWNLTSDSSVSSVEVSVLQDNSRKRCLASFQTDSCGDGSYCCTRLFPISLLKSLKDVVTARGNLCLLLEIETEVVENTQFMVVATKCVEKWYKQKLKNKDTFVESSTQTEDEIRLEKLGRDFREILLNGNISDITLKVKGQEFKAHKTVLAARSPVFLAMLMHDTKEKISGIVDIPDADPSIFPDFLNYLYSGNVDNLTTENAAKLYTLADKYQVNELKESCKDLMLMNISIDNFCDVFTLSLQHNQKELKEACIQFFAKNSLDIVLTCKWQTFLSENPITGNELFIKHLKLNK